MGGGGGAVHLDGVEYFFLEGEFEVFSGAVFEFAVEAGAVAHVAGGAAIDFDFEEEAVLVVVDHEFDDVLGEATLFAFDPYFIARAAVVGGFFGGDGVGHGFFVHVPEHEYLAGVCIEGDAGEDVVFVKTRRQLGAFFNFVNGECHRGKKVNALGAFWQRQSRY